MGGMPDPGTHQLLEFGSDRPRRRFPVAALAGDPRVVPLTATLAVVALFASLFSEWQVTTIAAAALGNQDEVGRRVLRTTLIDLGSLGSGYLTGLFLLVAAATLTLFGPPAGRRYARTAGLALGGTLLVLLAAATVLLHQQSRLFSQVFALDLTPGQLTVTYGRGLWCALVGVLLALLALHLAGRRPGNRTDDAATTSWTWWRPATDDEPGPEEPFELTVTSVQPFTAPPDRLDNRD
jgi:hypothetical protein